MPATLVAPPVKIKIRQPLRTGDRLTRAEFEQRYETAPKGTMAELIEGIVYIMPSPIHFRKHSKPHSMILTCLGVYEAAIEGIESGDNATVRLDPDNEVQPDALLRIKSAAGGRSHISDDDYVEGAPELIVEIAGSSVSYDLYDKYKIYRRNGVREYVVWRVYDEAIDWFQLDAGRYLSVQPDADGVIESEVFPGLRLDVDALLAGDLATALAVLQMGLSTPEHEAFVSQLAGKQNAG